MSEWEFRLLFSRWLKVKRMDRNMSRVDLTGFLNCRLLEVTNWETANSLPNAYQYYLIVGLFGAPEFVNGL